MSLTKCKDCAYSISRQAPVCPNCGVKIRRTSLLVKLLLLVLGISFFSMVAEQSSKYTEHAKKAQETTKEKQRLETLTPEQKEEEQKRFAAEAEANREKEKKRLGIVWNYDESTDSMSQGKTKSAYVRSLNEFEFDFPYTGRQRSLLHIRNHPRFGEDVILRVDKGQFLYDSDVTVRFDNEKPIQFSAVGPDDHSTTSLFLSNRQLFLSHLRKSKKIFIEAKFYRTGTKVFEFDVSGLQW